MSERSGFIQFGRYKSHYRIVGNLAETALGKFPILALHGYPFSHESMQPFGKLSETGRPVVFYDQLGCGQSDKPQDESIWNMALFVEELATVRTALGLDQIHLVGHSFGGMISLEYLLTWPAGIMSLTLHSTPVSIPLYISEAERLTVALPAEVRDSIAKHEAGGTTDDPAYREAMSVFDETHMWRVAPLPDYLLQSMKNQQVAPYFMMDWKDYQLEVVDPSNLNCGEPGAPPG